MASLEPQRPLDVDRLAGQAEAASEFLKALAHPSRLVILCELLHGEQSVGELEALLAQRQPAVSQQLARLRREGLVSARREGKTIFYSLADDKARSILAAVYRSFCGPEPEAREHDRPGRTRPSSASGPTS